MPADQLQVHLIIEHDDDLDRMAERVSEALGLPLARTGSDGFPDDRSQDRYEGSTLGMAWSLRGSERNGRRRYRLTGSTHSRISTGAGGTVSLDEPVRTLLARAGLEARTPAETRARR